MRPRVFPAEDASERDGLRRRPARFNEAAGIPRGRHQEAAMNRRARMLQ